jgi:glycosyltransferase involved in cell wall biosynthesis
MTAISIIIPIFNEEKILEKNIDYLIPQLRKNFDRFEIILSENGSIDATKKIAIELDKKWPEVIACIDDGIADYGEALINAINRSCHDEISILELDYLDLGFLNHSYQLLSDFDLVIGSKKISPKIDQRPWERKVFSNMYNFVLRKMFHIDLTETHGLKTFKKSKLDPIVKVCVSRHAVFPSELIIRASRNKNINICEIPLTLPLKEIRKTRITPIKRLKNTYKDLRLLHKVLKS